MFGFSQILLGILLLTAGQRLFWLFVGSLGFVAGMEVAKLTIGYEPAWAILLASLFCGAMGALLAIFFQTLAIGVGGFVAGATITTYLLNLAGFTSFPLLPLLGGVLCLILLYVAFDWTLIVLSTVAGSTLITQSIPIDQHLQAALYAVLIVIGLILQTNQLHRHPIAR